MRGCEIVEGVWLKDSAVRKNAPATRAMVSEWDLSWFTRKPFGFLSTNKAAWKSIND